MSEMVERVAEAIALAGNGGTWDDWYNAGQKEFHRKRARAAIEAMREPTFAMRREGWHELRKHNDIQTRLGNSLVGVETPTYQAMIDAALMEVG